MGKAKPVHHEGTWPVPYLSRLEGNNISAGQSLLIRGYVTEKKSIDINLGTGAHVETDGDRDNILMQISTRMDKKMIVLNSLTGNKWGNEKKLKCPFNVGHEFDFRIRVHENRFEIFGNRQPLGDYPLTQPLTALTHIYVTGAAELSTVSWEGKYYNLPYEALIPDHFKPGRKLNVSGEWTKDKDGRPTAKRFAINLFVNSDLALHFQTRFDEKHIVRNSQVADKWQEEVKTGKWPFKRTDNNFDMIISCEEREFKMYIDGILHSTFAHRLPAHNINKITIEGDAELHAVHLK